MFTLVQHRGYAKRFDLEFHLMVEPAPVENVERTGLLPLFDAIRMKGGLLLEDPRLASKRADLENHPADVPGLGAGVRGTFAQNLVIELGGWHSPLYLPGWSDYRIRQLIEYQLLVAGEYGMSRGLLWDTARKLGIRLKAFESVMLWMCSFGHVDRERHTYRLPVGRSVLCRSR